MLERGNLIDAGRTHGLRGLRAVILIAAAAVMTGAVILLPASLSNRIIESDLRNAADDWRQRVVGQLSRGPDTFALSSLTSADREVLELISRTSEIQQIDLIDTEGRIFWATRDDLIGQHQEVAQVGTAGSQVNYAVRFVNPNPDSTPFGAVAGSPRAVAEIEIPVTEARGGVVGWLELHHDITLIRATSILRIRLALVAGAILAFGALLGGSALIRTNRNRTLEADARARQLKVVMAEQIRLTREVHLLGQINEWPSSSRTQGELFQAVARFIEHVLPSWSGSLYVLSVSGDVLDGVVSWNGGTHLGHLRAADSALISQGRACAANMTDTLSPSPQPEVQVGGASLCIPIRAQGETVGLLSLAAGDELDEATLATQRRLAQAGADQISMAVANARMRDALQQQAVRDPLTGLFNRRHLLETVRRALDMRLFREASVLAIGVDQLDRFNEEHGHDAGDMILRAVAGVLRRHAEGDAIAARAGGAELTLVLPKVSEAEAMKRAEQIRKELAALAMRLGPVTLQGVVVSVGVAQLPRDGIRPVEAIRAASDALQGARAQGGDKVMGAGSGTGEAAAWAVDCLADNTAGPSGDAPRLIA